MNFAEMDKEKKQLLLLGAIVLVTVCYAGLNYGLNPVLERWSDNESELQTLEGTLRRARRLTANREQITNDLEESKQQLHRAFADYVPNRENPLSWATQAIYAEARSSGIDIEAVSEMGINSTLQGMVNKGDRKFRSYAVRIVTTCSYEEVRRFIGALQQSNPYLSVVGVNIMAHSARPQRHAVNIDVEWPAWPADADMDALFSTKGV